MAHPGNEELAHRQQFYFWKNYQNNRLKFILPKPSPEPVAAPPAPASAPPQPPMQSVPTTTVAAMTAPSGSDLSPMPYDIPSGSAFGDNGMRSGVINRRKGKNVSPSSFS